jgi:ketosteroid isomerase-like protein
MSVEQNKRIASEFFEAGNRGDMERCMALVADDVSWTDMGTMKFSGTYIGKEQLAANLLAPLFSQLKAGIHTTIDRVIAEGDFVVVLNRGQAETVDGKAYNNSYCHVMKIANGQIAEVIEYSDSALISQVFGS